LPVHVVSGQLTAPAPSRPLDGSQLVGAMSKTANDPVTSINLWIDGECKEVMGNYTLWQRDLDSDCCPGGWFIPDIVRNPVLCVIWILLLGYIFMGVAIGADTFMASIEQITSQEKTVQTVKEKNERGEDINKLTHYRVWNATIANLTLMALGSSAPEILLSVLEVLQQGMNAGELGPSTIVGSAAFNLMVITAVCIVCIPAGETRTLRDLGVFLTTATYSLVAYIWLFIMVIVSSPERITIAEGVITCVLLVCLIAHAYIVDKYSQKRQENAKIKSITGTKGIKASEVLESLKQAGVDPDSASDAEMKFALQDDFKPKSYYRHKSNEAMAGHSKHATPKVAPTTEGVEIGVDGGQPKRVAAEVDAAADSGPPSIPIPPAGLIRWRPYYDEKKRCDIAHAVKVNESDGQVLLEVERLAGSGGAKGAVEVRYFTKDQTARGGKDYEKAEGKLTWGDGETDVKKVNIMVLDDDELEKDEQFTVCMVEPTGGAVFDPATDGGEESEVFTVIIINDDDRVSKMASAIRMLRIDADALDLASGDWMGNIKDCFDFEGGPSEKAFKILNFPWKLMFNFFVPPPALCGGFPCFICALLAIGFQVMLISDFATQVGCQMYIKNAVTAITFVALGTSLPDTFASMQAAKEDKYADNSVGNVTGSNSVNVFFGLCLPWLMGAIYWKATGVDSSWVERFHPVSGTHPLPTDIYTEFVNDGGAFVVRSGDLGLSVIVFTCCAICTIALILVRRKMGNQELGGDRGFAQASAGILVLLWFVYLIISICASYGFIVVEFNF